METQTDTDKERKRRTESVVNIFISGIIFSATMSMNISTNN